MRRLSLLGLAVLPLAAGAGPEAPAPSGSLVDRMQSHFTDATDARKAVIDGDLVAARAAGAALAKAQAEGLPEQGKPLFEAMTGIAGKVAAATDLPEAAQAIGALGATCGGCHAALDRGPRKKLADLPDQKWSTDSHMNRHAWAADWMWLGLVASSDEAWAKGVSALTEAPTWEAVHDTPGLAKGNAEVLEQQVHLLADKARELDSKEERAELYGWFVTACAECHTRIR